MPKCLICGQANNGWLPPPHLSKISEFCWLMDLIGSDPKRYLCPHCQCNDRDRHLWLYMNSIGLQKEISKFSILHVAPELHISALLAQLQPQNYVRGDLQPRQEGHIKLDIESMPFDDESFHLAICNHVLEHVARPEQALAELYRCLAPGGILIAQTPYSRRLKTTFEVLPPVSPTFANMFFGQEDHVRMFGSDISRYFAQAGFKGEPLPHHTVLGDINPDEVGINPDEPFFIFSK